MKVGGFDPQVISKCVVLWLAPAIVRNAGASPGRSSTSLRFGRPGTRRNQAGSLGCGWNGKFCLQGRSRVRAAQQWRSFGRVVVGL